MERNKFQNDDIERLLDALENGSDNLEEVQAFESDADVIEIGRAHV